jgi:uncharacterized protein (TIGR02001 family)
MSRRRLPARIKESLVSLVLLSGYAALSPAAAFDSPSSKGSDLTFLANVTLTTDYIYRGLSQTGEKPAIQGYIELDYQIFYLGIWGSNVDYGLGFDPAGNLVEVADLEMSWYGGFKPVWRGTAST